MEIGCVTVPLFRGHVTKCEKKEKDGQSKNRKGEIEKRKKVELGQQVPRNSKVARQVSTTPRTNTESGPFRPGMSRVDSAKRRLGRPLGHGHATPQHSQNFHGDCCFINPRPPLANRQDSKNPTRFPKLSPGSARIKGRAK